ncbi:MAG: radical SAM protein [Flammeovirgaceae bacterium]
MLQSINVKSVLNKTKKRDAFFLDDYTLNPYSGCSFNCLFCYIRGSKYGTHLEPKVTIKSNAVELLEKQLHLRAKRNEYGVIIFSSATEPYLQFEGATKLTRSLLEVIAQYRFPVHMLTRSNGILRDFDLLSVIDRTAIPPQHLKHKTNRGVFITFSFGSLHDEVAKIFEPGATPPTQRLDTLKAALSTGFHSGVSFMPMLPYITDTAENLYEAYELFQLAKVKYVYGAGLTLFGTENSSSRMLVFRAIEKHYPHLIEKYQRLFGQSDYLPPYYHQAFVKKLKQLSHDFGIPQLIC